MQFPVVLAIVWLGAVSLAPAIAASAADAVLAQANAALAGGQYAAVQALVTGGLAEPGLDGLVKSRLLVVRGLAQQAQGAPNEALVDFTIGLQGDALQGEERARALFARGLALDGQGRLEAAIGDYTAALQVSPRATYALNNRANVYRRQGRFAEARRDYSAALAANTPNPQYPYYGLGQIAEAEGDIQAARGLYSRALTADPAFQLARERLASLGAPVTGPAGLPADTGIIVLKPPGSAQASVVLRPPPGPRPGNRMQQDTGAPPLPVSPLPVAQTRRRPPSPAAPPGRGAPLRPAIVDSRGFKDEGKVQLGAWRTEAEARTGWAIAQAQADGLLEGLMPVIVPVELAGRGIFHRLRVPSRGTPTKFCAALAEKGLSCLPVRD